MSLSLLVDMTVVVMVQIGNNLPHGNNKGIQHVFSCINVCQVPRKMLKPEGKAHGF